MNHVHPTAVIDESVTFYGDYNDIGAFCYLGAAPEWKEKHTNHGVLIGGFNTITGLVTIDGGGESPTYIGNGCYIMKHAHIGHDCNIGDNVTISCGAKIGGHTMIKRGANIGLNAVIHQRQVIEEGVMIGMGSVVTKGLKTEPYKIYAGNPAKYIGENINHPNYESRNSITRL